MAGGVRRASPAGGLHLAKSASRYGTGLGTGKIRVRQRGGRPE